MRGYPKFLNSKKDVEYVTKHFDEEKWLPDLKGLLASVKDWFFVAKLDSKEDGITDEEHKVCEVGDDPNNPQYAQYELRINEKHRIFRMGMTVEEVQTLADKGEQTLAAKFSASA